MRVRRAVRSALGVCEPSQYGVEMGLGGESGCRYIGERLHRCPTHAPEVVVEARDEPWHEGEKRLVWQASQHGHDRHAHAALLLQAWVQPADEGVPKAGQRVERGGVQLAKELHRTEPRVLVLILEQRERARRVLGASGGRKRAQKLHSAAAHVVVLLDPPVA